MDVNKFIVFADPRFIGYAKNELISAFSKYEYKESDKTEVNGFFSFEAALDSDKVLSMAKELTFIENVIPLATQLNDFGKDYSNIIEAVASNLQKDRSFKIEVKRVWSHIEENAKSVEVKIGTKLESLGFAANLVDPEIFIYIIILEDIAMIGKIDRNAASNHVLDSFRVTNVMRQKNEKISRSEFKLAEALDYFNVDTNKMKSAIDIGAAPGGWVRLISNRGLRTVAVDVAVLDYEKLKKGNKILVIQEKPLEINGVDTVLVDSVKQIESKYNIIHIKQQLQNIKPDILNKFGKFDMLLMDANINPEESSELVLKLSDLLSDKATIIITIKLIDDNVYKHINKTKETLSSKYNSIKVKKLPHNRMEVTLFAKKI